MGQECKVFSVEKVLLHQFTAGTIMHPYPARHMGLKFTDSTFSSVEIEIVRLAMDVTRALLL